MCPGKLGPGLGSPAVLAWHIAPAAGRPMETEQVFTDLLARAAAVRVELVHHMPFHPEIR